MDTLAKSLTQWNIDITSDQIDKFNKYYELLVDWNSRMNLTSITELEEVIHKHFVDSIALLHYQDISDCSIIDVGTGAGFPGIPLKIMCPNSNVVLLDSLAKRVNFLNEVINVLSLDGIVAVHGRAEDFAHDKKYRAKFDYATSRAVANLATLSEYCLPFVKVDGCFVPYKSGNIDEEVTNANKAIRVLGGEVIDVKKYNLPYTDFDRSIIFINKLKDTPKQYPRKAGTPSKSPIA